MHPEAVETLIRIPGWAIPLSMAVQMAPCTFPKGKLYLLQNQRSSIFA